MQSLAVLAMATLLLAGFFQCCPSATVEEPSIQAPTEQRAAAQATRWRHVMTQGRRGK